MKKEIILAVLKDEGVKGDAKGYTLDGDREAACFIRGSSDPILVTRVSRIVLQDAHLVLHTDREGRFFFTYEDVIGLRMNPPKKEGAAGFGR